MKKLFLLLWLIQGSLFAANSGLFQSLAPHNVGKGPNSIAVADFNSDGHPDAAVLNFTDKTVSILINDGTDNLTPSAVLALPPTFSGLKILAYDLNNDGHPDLLLLGQDGKILTLNGTGGINFNAPIQLADSANSSITAPVTFAVGSMSADATSLIVVLGADGAATSRIGFLAITASGTLNLGSNTAAPAGYVFALVTMRDLNHDGFGDALVALYNAASQTTALYDFAGSSAITPTGGSILNVPSPTAPSGMACADFNNDGLLDLLFTYSSATNSKLLLANAPTSFNAPQDTGIAAYGAPVTADFNGDGNQDFASIDPTTGSVAVAINGGSGNFTAAAGSPYSGATALGGTGAKAMAAADFNLDGGADLLVVNSDPANVNPPSNNATVLLSRYKTSSILTLQTGTTPSAYGTGLVFRTTVTPLLGGSGNVAGSVQFFDNGAAMGSPVAVSAAGVADTASVILTGGAHVITARFSSAAGFIASNANSLSQQITQLSRTLTLLSSGNPSIFGQPVTFTATLTAPAGTALLTGSVTFFNNSIAIGTAPLVGSSLTSTATLTTSLLGVSANSITATYNGDANYASVTSISLTQNITKATAFVGLGSLNVVYDGNTHAVSVATNPAGLATTVTYNALPTAPTAAGSYAVVATISDVSYQGTASGTLVITPAGASIALGNLNATYDGNAHSAMATTTPAGKTVSLTYNGLPTAPTTAGSYAIVGTIIDPNFQGSITGTLVIAKATAVVNLSNLNATYDTNSHAVTVVTTPPGLTTVITYNGLSAAPTAAGNYTVQTVVNDANYQGSAGGTLTIAKATALVSVSNLNVTYDGNPHAATITTAPASLAILVTYNGSVTPPSVPGAYTVVSTVTDANYAGVATNILSIEAADAIIALNALNVVYDGMPHAAAVSTTPPALTVGVTYNGLAQAPTAAGTYSVLATVNEPFYQGTASGVLTIAKAPVSITLDNLNATYDGNAHAATTSTTPAGVIVAVTYNGSSGIPVAAGAYAVIGTVVDNNYQGTVAGALTIAKATPVMTWNTPADIITGASLSTAQLNASANVPGTLTYTPDSGTILPRGKQTLLVSFNPADSANYANATVRVPLNVVNAAPSLASLPTVTPSPATTGVPVIFTAAASDLEGDALKYVWNFGDGSQAIGSSALHVFSASGTFEVTLLVDDGQGGTTTATLSVPVMNLPTLPGAGDSDGDGFTDALEIAAGTSPSDAADTPLGGLSGANPLELPNAALRIKLNFAKPNVDTIRLTGKVLIPSAFTMADSRFMVDIGGAARAFTLDRKGLGSNGTDFVAVKGAGKKSTAAQFTVQFQRGNFASVLNIVGLTNQSITRDVTIPIQVVFAGKTYGSALFLTYSATAGLLGSVRGRD